MGLTWDQLNPGEYIKAGEFGGKDVTMTITAVDRNDFLKDDGTPEKRGVISFSETERKWVTNATNIQLLKALWPRPEDAIGHKVTLYAEKVKFGRETVEGIRVKGAPHLTSPVIVAVKLPRKKAVDHKLVPTGDVSTPPAEPDPEPLPCVAVCSKCGAESMASPDATDADFADAFCAGCGAKGSMKVSS